VSAGIVTENADALNIPDPNCCGEAVEFSVKWLATEENVTPRDLGDLVDSGVEIYAFLVLHQVAPDDCLPSQELLLPADEFPCTGRRDDEMATDPVVFRKPKVINIASVPHRSPFRYPGGKTWLIPQIRKWLSSTNPKPQELAEPFAGGAIVGLSALFEDFVQKLVLIEKDEDVASVWEVIVNGQARKLADAIVGFEFSEGAVKRILASHPNSVFDRAFQTILRNRVQRGGILAPGASLLKNGENGKGMASRWYPTTLRNRIEAILHMRRNISFINADGIEFIRYNAHRTDTVFFIDPPYTLAGRRLYAHSELDHEELFKVVSTIKGDFLMTYDNSKEIKRLAEKFDLQTALVAMKNTHHEIMSELLVGKNLRWLE
jgi:DNA adenine methylase